MNEAFGRERIQTIVALTVLFLLVVAGGVTAQTTTTGGDETATTEGAPATTDDSGAPTTESTAPPPEEEGQASGEGTGGFILPAPADLAALNPDLRAEQLIVQVWPEYDTADVLVLADIRLPADVAFPVEMQMPIPQGARLTGVAEVRDDGSFDYSRPAPTPNLEAGTPDWDVYNITIPKTRDVRIEYYYDPGLTLTGARSYQVNYRVPMDVDAANVTVQEPLRATGFSVDPPLTQSSTGPQGFTYLSENVGAAQENQVLSVGLSYSKPDAEPSISATVDEESSSNSSLILWLIVIVAAGILAFVVYRLFLRPSPAPAGRSAGRGKAGGSSGEKGAGGQKSGGASRFCTQCGAKLNKRDRFCPECGHERE